MSLPITPDDVPAWSYWRPYIAALCAAEQADTAHHQAQVDSIGDPDRRKVRDAEWQRFHALERVAEVRSDIIDDLLLAVRLALHLRPVGLDDVLRRVPAVQRLRRRVRRLERVLAALAGRKGVRHG